MSSHSYTQGWNLPASDIPGNDPETNWRCKKSVWLSKHLQTCGAKSLTQAWKDGWAVSILAAKADDVRSAPKIHVVEGENRPPPKGVLWSQAMAHVTTYILTTTTNVNKKCNHFSDPQGENSTLPTSFSADDIHRQRTMWYRERARQTDHHCKQSSILLKTLETCGTLSSEEGTTGELIHALLTLNE